MLYNSCIMPNKITTLESTMSMVYLNFYSLQVFTNEHGLTINYYVYEL